MKFVTPVTLLIVGGVMLILALLPMPYGYYQFLRIVICGVAIFSLYTEDSINGVDALKWPMIIIAILYNPLIPIHLAKEIWIFLNIATAGFWGYTAYALKRNGNRET